MTHQIKWKLLASKYALKQKEYIHFQIYKINIAKTSQIQTLHTQCPVHTQLVTPESCKDTHEEEAVLAKIIHARPTNILILRKISLLYSPPVAHCSAAVAAIAAFFILATALSVSWRSDWALLLFALV